MAINHFHVYLFSSVNNPDYKSKLIFADNENEARDAVEPTFQIKSTFVQSKLIDDGAKIKEYSCQEIYVKCIRFEETVLDCLYLGNLYSLPKNFPKPVLKPRII